MFVELLEIKLLQNKTCRRKTSTFHYEFYNEVYAGHLSFTQYCVNIRWAKEAFKCAHMGSGVPRFWAPE